MAAKLDLSKHQALLDVAGGSGIYACSVVARHPHLCAAVFEKPPVDRIARGGHRRRRGCAEKVEVVAGDMFKDEWPGGTTRILISNVLHDWEEPTMRRLRSRSRTRPCRWMAYIDHP